MEHGRQGARDLKQIQSIVVLTGAGISAESGIKTFRDHDGLWEQHRLEDVCTPEGFARNPSLVHQFYNARRQQLLGGVEPNPAHFALAKLQQQFSGKFLLVTQNVDNLHERAGSANAIHMHGELLKVRCVNSGEVMQWKQDTSVDIPCPCCNIPGALRPQIVWFGEMPLAMDNIDQALTHCDLFIAIGTSGQVYPAAGFVNQAKRCGAYCVELNLEVNPTSPYFDEHISGPASVTLNQFLQRLI